MVYLSLGSNQGNRIEYIQLALGLLTYRVGKIKTISRVYQTPAWGFESHPFLNLCLCLETLFEPIELMKELLEIEEYLGRKRSEGSGYQARIIDLDILYYENQIYETSSLCLPHPRIEERHFVLTPLVEIAADFIDPKTKKSIRQLQKECPDKTKLEVIDQHIVIPKKRKFVAIEGNIGAGKTAFTNALNQALKGVVLLERFYDNPHLADFYQDPTAFAVAVETAFLLERALHYKTFFAQPHTSTVFADFCIQKSLLFAQQNLSPQQFKQYREKFLDQTVGFPVPDLILFLDQSLTRVQDNIKQRGRDFEQNIKLEYLRKIEEAYAQWILSSKLPIERFSLKELDFVKRSADFHQLLLRFFRL